jgi:hypothetical protein
MGTLQHLYLFGGRELFRKKLSKKSFLEKSSAKRAF